MYSSGIPPVTTTYIVHEPTLPVTSAPIVSLPIPPAVPVLGKHDKREIKIKEKLHGHSIVSPAVPPAYIDGAGFVAPMAPALGKHDKVEFRMKEKLRGR
jgi:hypothetical protein